LKAKGFQLFELALIIACGGLLVPPPRVVRKRGIQEENRSPGDHIGDLGNLSCLIFSIVVENVRLRGWAEYTKNAGIYQSLSYKFLRSY